MDSNLLLKQIAESKAVSCFVPEYIREDNKQKREDEGLGIAITKFCDYDGVQIMKIFIASLEDANFRNEANIVQEWLDGYENESLEYKEE